MEALRTAVVGAGSSGRVHARSAAWPVPGWPAWPGRRRPRGRGLPRPLPGGAGLRLGEELVEADGIDVVHVATPSHLHEPLALKALAAGKHVVCEKPVALDGDGAQRLAGRRRGEWPRRGRAVRLPVPPHDPRGPGPHRRRRAGPSPPRPLPAGLAAHGGRRQLAGRLRGAGRPGPSPTSARTGATSSSSCRATASPACWPAPPPSCRSGRRSPTWRARRRRRAPAGRDGGRRPGAVRDRPGALGVDAGQPGVGRAQNRLWFELDGEHAAIAFDQEEQERCGSAAASRARSCGGTPRCWRPTPPGLTLPPKGTPRAITTASTCSWPTPCAAIRGGPPEGLPLVGDGLRAARITDAVLASAHAVLDRGEPMKLGFLTACLPKRSRWRTSPPGGPATATRPWRWRPGRRSATGPSPPPPRRRRLRPGRGAGPVRRARPDDVVAGLLRQQPPSRPGRAGGGQPPRPAVHRRRRRPGLPTVGTFVGRHPGRSVTENLADAEEVFAPLVERAGERGVKIIVENCVMEGWHPTSTPATSPTRPSCGSGCSRSGLYLNFDPSTSCGSASTSVAAVRPYLDRIPAQAKDVELFPGPAALRLLRQGRRAGRPLGRGLVAFTGCSLGRSTGSAWSTPCTRAASTASCRSSTRTRCGAAPRSRSKPAWTSPTAPSAPCSSRGCVDRRVPGRAARGAAAGAGDIAGVTAPRGPG